jgi:hypothetical protein
MVLSGDEVFGEEHRHELAHLVLRPLLEQRRTHSLVNEGFATMLGGTRGDGRGDTFNRLLIDYAVHLKRRPTLTLDSVLWATGEDLGWYPTAALLVRMVHERGGTAAVKELITSGRSDAELRAALSRLLRMSWSEIGRAWRARLDSMPIPPRDPMPLVSSCYPIYGPIPPNVVEIRRSSIPDREIPAGKGGLSVTVLSAEQSMPLRYAQIGLTRGREFSPGDVGVLSDSARVLLTADPGAYYVFAGVVLFRSEHTPVTVRAGFVDSVLVRLAQTGRC